MQQKMYALPGITPSDRFADSSLKARRSILFLQRSVLSDTGGLARSAWPRIDQRDGMQRRRKNRNGYINGFVGDPGNRSAPCRSLP
jgi:hypothetical protein